MKIFVTGGTGFIGKHVLECLSQSNHQILVLCRKKIETKRNIEFIEGDLSNRESWIDKLRSFKPESAIHLAWEGIPDFSLGMCLKNINYGTELIENLCELGCKKIIVSGSCFEYGELKGKLSETANPKNISVFASSKRALHEMATAIAKKHGTALIWTRLFYVYGPGQRKASLIPSLIANKMSSKTPDLKNPRAQNDFIYVTDVARALVELTLNKNVCASDTFNVGSGKMTPVRKIADLVYGIKPKKSYPAEKSFFADLNRIKKASGWVPEISIENGIKQTLQNT